jgi:hypothetical protein
MKDRTSAQGEACPFHFNFDPATFMVGDTVSYRVEGLGDFPFVGTLLEVHDDHVLLSENDPSQPPRRLRGTRESRPWVTRVQALGPG